MNVGRYEKFGFSYRIASDDGRKAPRQKTAKTSAIV